MLLSLCFPSFCNHHHLHSTITYFYFFFTFIFIFFVFIFGFFFYNFLFLSLFYIMNSVFSFVGLFILFCSVGCHISIVCSTSFWFCLCHKIHKHKHGQTYAYAHICVCVCVCMCIGEIYRFYLLSEFVIVFEQRMPQKGLCSLLHAFEIIYLFFHLFIYSRISKSWTYFQLSIVCLTFVQLTELISRNFELLRAVCSPRSNSFYVTCDFSSFLSFIHSLSHTN